MQKQTQQFYNILCSFLCLCFTFRDKTWDRSGIHVNAIFEQAAKWGGNTLKKFELNFLINYRIHLHNFSKSPSLSPSLLKLLSPFCRLIQSFPRSKEKQHCPQSVCACLPQFCQFWWGWWWCCLLPFIHPFFILSFFFLHCFCAFINNKEYRFNSFGSVSRSLLSYCLHIL